MHPTIIEYWIVYLKTGAIVMKQGKQRVSIKLTTTIDDQGEIEYNTMKESGHFYSKGKIDVLIYEEEIEKGAIVRNLITIQPTKVTIKRTGIVEMNQSFILGKITESHFQHPHGAFHMETDTKSFTYDSLTEAEAGRLFIAYTVKLNGMQERKHVLELTYQKEDEA